MFSERDAAHSVALMFSLYVNYLYFLLFSVFGDEGWILILIASVPGFCIRFYFYFSSL